MSTRCLIAIDCGEGVARSIYCHWDGYLQGVGDRLIRDYTRSDIAELMTRVPSVSALQPTIETTIADRESYSSKSTKSTVVVHHGDRKEIQRLLVCRAESCSADYIYLHTGECWEVSTNWHRILVDREPWTFVSLAEEIAEREPVWERMYA